MVKLIRSISLIYLLTLYSIAAQQNSNEFIPAVGGVFLPCSPESDCYRYILQDDLDYMHLNHHQSVSNSNRPLCSPRKFRQLIAYDDSLLVDYTHHQIDSLIKIHHDFFKIGMDSSGIQNYVGTEIVGLFPIDIPITYTSIHDVSNWLGLQWLNKQQGIVKVKNDSLDADHLLIITHQNCPTSLGNTGVNTQMASKPELPPDNYHLFWERNKGVVNFNVLFIKPTSKNTLGHEIGHGIGGDHEAPSNSSITPKYARAFRGDSVKTNTIVMCCGSNLVPRFSGPNSKIIKDGRTLTLGNDTINNVRHISEVLNDFWCATENHVTRVSLPVIVCGNGNMKAITNNADTFQWKVLSGDCNIIGTGKEISYMAISLSKIQVIAQKKGKWYWDTATVEIPAIIESKVDVSIKSGETYTLPDGMKVDKAGTYRSIIKASSGCDEVIIIILRVITSVEYNNAEDFNIIPIPNTGMFRIENLQHHDKLFLYDLHGHSIPFQQDNNVINIQNSPASVYQLIIQTKHQIVRKVICKM